MPWDGDPESAAKGQVQAVQWGMDGPCRPPVGRGIRGPVAARGGFPPDTPLSALLVSGVRMSVWLAEMRGYRVPPDSPPATTPRCMSCWGR